jgi:hypothetical protein
LRALRVSNHPHSPAIELAIAPVLDVFTQMPNVSELVLSVEDELRFPHRAVIEVPIPTDERANTTDNLGEIGDREHNLAIDPFTVVGKGSSLPYIAFSRFHWKPRVVDGR